MSATRDTRSADRQADGPSAVERICVGIISGPHGIGGAVKVRSFTEEPGAIMRYGPLHDGTGRRRFTLRVIGEARGQLIVRLDGISDRNQAETLRGVQLYADRAALPQPDEDEEYYHADLIGLLAERTDGAVLGRIRAVHDFGAGPVLEIAPPEGVTVMVPFTRAVVPAVELEAGRLVVDPPPGLLEPTGDEAEDRQAGHKRVGGRQVGSKAVAGRTPAKRRDGQTG